MTIAVDFDGTIVEHAYPAIGKPIPFAIDVLKRLQDECHHQLILWSVREGALLDEAVEYCRKQGLEFYAVNKNYPEETFDGTTPRKLTADIFIDDRNLGGLPDWGVIYRVIRYGESLTSAYSGSDVGTYVKKRSFFERLFKKKQ